MKRDVTLDNNLWYARIKIVRLCWLKIQNSCDPLAYVKLFQKLYKDNLSYNSAHSYMC